jgi:uncharacterized protein (TIGR02118 family)
MIKLIFLLSRKPEIDRQAFQDYWLHTHAPLVLVVPGVREFRQHHARADQTSLTETFDGIAEIVFDREEDIDAALASAEWQAVERDAANFIQAAQRLVATEHRLMPS